MGQLENKVALITGAGSGMGRMHAIVMSARGAKIIVNDINERGLNETIEAVVGAGGKAVPALADITDQAAVEATVARGRAAFGPIDILVNNAGIGSGRLAFEQIDDAVLSKIFDINVKGAFFCARAVLPDMKSRRSGKIINISSMWGMSGARFASHYCAAKAAVLGFTKAWAREFAPWNIHVNAVAPGSVATPMALSIANVDRAKEVKERVPLGRFASAEEISYAVAFLASAEADFITGQVLSPNGGEVIVG